MTNWRLPTLPQGDTIPNLSYLTEYPWVSSYMPFNNVSNRIAKTDHPRKTLEPPSLPIAAAEYTGYREKVRV